MDIYIENLKKKYSDKEVLNLDKLVIKKGRITGIIGQNGSGKTTLINILAGLDCDYEGLIKYNGSILDKSILKKITLVLQKPYLFRASVLKNIEYPLKIRRIDSDTKNKKTQQILERLKIKDLKSKKANKLSGGESQKVSLARALIFEPKLLLLDEPTSNIDKESIEIIEKEIVRFNKDTNSTIVLITHDYNQAKRLCHELVYIENGMKKKIESI